MKKLTLTLFLTSLLVLTACGKKEESPVAKYEIGDKTVKVYEDEGNNEETTESFELLSESITLECGVELSTDVTEYVKTKHPENIEMSEFFQSEPENLEKCRNMLKFPYETATYKTFSSIPAVLQNTDGTKHYIAFKDMVTDYLQFMQVEFVDTTMPTYEIGTKECDIYLQALDWNNEPTKIGQGSFEDWESINLKEDFNLSYEDKDGVASLFIKNNEESVKEEPSFNSGQTYNPKLYDITPDGTPGTFEETLVILDCGKNRIEIPVTFNIIDDLSPENKQLQNQLNDENASWQEQESLDAAEFEKRLNQSSADVLDELNNPD